MMEAFKAVSPDFYEAYFATRIVIHRTGAHAAANKPAPATA
jgi:hypothetical protein